MNDSKRTLVRYIVLIVDTITMLAVYLLANLIKFGNFRTGIFNPNDYYLGLYFSALMSYLVVSFLIFPYDDILARNWIKEAFTVVKLYAYIAALNIGYLYITKTSWYYSRVQMALFFGGSIVCVFVVRQILKRIFLKSYHRSGANEKILLVTTEAQVPAIIKKIKSTRNWYFRISNLVIVDRDMVGEDIMGFDVVANLESLIDYVSTAEIDTVFLAIDGYELEYHELIQKIAQNGKNIRIAVKEFEYDHGNKEIGFLGQFAVVNYSTKRYRIRHMTIKRLFDIIVGIIGCVIYLLVWILASIGLMLERDMGHVVVSTVKVGKNGRRFYMQSFRTIRYDAPNGEVRNTKTGAVLKFLGLDTIPMAWNLLWGDISLVGVKLATLPEFVEYSSSRRSCLNMKPGIIGFGQLNSTKFTMEEADEYYFDNWSVWLDIKILIESLTMVFRKEK